MNLTVGNSTGSNRSLLSLDNTQWTVENFLLVGARGDIAITLGPLYTGGIDLLSDAEGAFLIGEGGNITVNFGDVASNELVWGLRMLGDHVDLFEDYLAANAIVGTGAMGEFAGVFTDGSYTYFGVQAIPEPSVVGLLLIGALGTLAARRRGQQA